MPRPPAASPAGSPPSTASAGEPAAGPRASESASGGPAPPPRPRVNDLAFKIGTVNGTGSASANGLLRRAIFRMGVPVSGKNLFPSNIQGLPTWYEIRANARGHTARTARFDVVVAMNPESYARDVAETAPGGWVLHDSSWPLPRGLDRDDVTFLGVPLARMTVENFEGSRTRILMKNICYVGALAALLDIHLDVVKELLRETFSAKPKLLDANFRAIALGHDYARERFDCPLPVRLEPMAGNDDSILVDGNTAAALGCMYAGATVAAWYPITPSTSLVDAFAAFCGKHRKEPGTGKNRFAIVQAEDELAAAGMVVGAAWAGARAFTSTSGAGLSLMSEFIGLAYYAEVPSVFFDVQRVGPSTGMPTRTQQGDLQFAAYASHGDTKHVVLFPADPRECFDFAVEAFDLAERLQTPVFVLTDLDIGMNDWVVPKLEWDDAYRPDRGKVLSAAQLEETRTFHRYLDKDGDGIPARTLPGVHPNGAFVTRGSGHDRYGAYTEDSEPYSDVLDRLARKIEGAVSRLPPPEIAWAEASAAEGGQDADAAASGRDGAEAGTGANGRPSAGAGTAANGQSGPAERVAAEAAGGRIGLVTIGGCRGAVLEAMDELARRGIAADFLRVRAFPFHPEVESFLARHETNFVVEQNRDGQLRKLLAAETGASKDRLVPVLYYGGLPLSCHHVMDAIEPYLRTLAEAAAAASPGG